MLSHTCLGATSTYFKCCGCCAKYSSVFVFRSKIRSKKGSVQVTYCSIAFCIGSSMAGYVVYHIFEFRPINFRRVGSSSNLLGFLEIVSAKPVWKESLNLDRKRRGRGEKWKATKIRRQGKDLLVRYLWSQMASRIACLLARKIFSFGDSKSLSPHHTSQIPT